MYLIFDTETTGLPKKWNAPLTDSDNWPRCVQLSWQIHDQGGGLISNRDYLIKNKMLPEWHPEYKDGSIIIFPAMFTHRVEQNETDEDRISLSFNINYKI